MLLPSSKMVKNMQEIQSFGNDQTLVMLVISLYGLRVGGQKCGGLPFPRRNPILFSYHGGAKKKNLKHLLLCLYSSMNICLLPNQHLFHTSSFLTGRSHILLWDSYAFWVELSSLPALRVGPNWPKHLSQ